MLLSFICFKKPKVINFFEGETDIYDVMPVAEYEKQFYEESAFNILINQNEEKLKAKKMPRFC